MGRGAGGGAAALAQALAISFRSSARIRFICGRRLVRSGWIWQAELLGKRTRAESVTGTRHENHRA
jgi:hypothetical protein